VPLSIFFAVFPVIFVAELPDKTMFASLILSTRGHRLAVWIGASLAFTVHVVIAVTIGTALFRVLPDQLVKAGVAVMFLAGAVFAWRDSVSAEEESGEESVRRASRQTVVATAFAVIFIAEWGDLTQILTATLAAHYQDALTVAVAAACALWAVAALAVTAGRVLERLPMALLRRVTAVILVVLALIAGAEALTGWAGPI
jgi:putative Ca2+/H+ antiporter (TMEM165/GDT1 family)